MRKFGKSAGILLIVAAAAAAGEAPAQRAAPAGAPPENQPTANEPGTCGEVVTACERAGYMRGFLAGCIDSLVETGSRLKGWPLPKVSPQAVADCKAARISAPPPIHSTPDLQE
jgi:hypothetical protein